MRFVGSIGQGHLSERLSPQPHTLSSNRCYSPLARRIRSDAFAKTSYSIPVAVVEKQQANISNVITAQKEMVTVRNINTGSDKQQLSTEKLNHNTTNDDNKAFDALSIYSESQSLTHKHHRRLAAKFGVSEL